MAVPARVVYHVSITLRNGGVLGKGTSMGWLAPASSAYHIGPADDVISSDDGTLEIGRPGADLRTYVQSITNGKRGLNTTLTYFPPPTANLVMPFTGLPVLRAYLGDTSPGAPKYTVTHSDGHVELVWPFGTGFIRELKAVGVPEPQIDKFERTAVRARVVMTILAKSTVSSARYAQLFAINPARADTIVRTLKPGVAPTKPSPSYWVGASWDRKPAASAISQIQTRTHTWLDSYTIDYGHSANPYLPAPALGGLTITTNSASPFNAAPTGLPHRRITLANGTPATVYFQSWKLPTGKQADQLINASPQSVIFVSTAASQIQVFPQARVTFAQAITIARALRPV